MGVRVDPDDPDDPDAPILCYTVYNDRHNDVNVKLTITPDVDGCCNHHQPDVNPIEFRVNSMRHAIGFQSRKIDSDNDSTSPANGDDATPSDHAPSTGDAEINCPVCTFLNPADAHHCQMCFSELTS